MQRPWGGNNLHFRNGKKEVSGAEGGERKTRGSEVLCVHLTFSLSSCISPSGLIPPPPQAGAEVGIYL